MPENNGYTGPELREFLENERFVITYRVLFASESHAAVECEIHDQMTHVTVIRMSEAKDDVSPIRRAYNGAFLIAGNAMVLAAGLDKKPPVQKPEEEDIPLPADDELIIVPLNGVTGRTFADVKDDPAFLHFAEQLANTEGVRFSEEAVNDQVQRLINWYRKENG